MKFLAVRLVLAAGAAEVHLRRHFARIMWALTPHPESDEPFAGLQRIESDPEYRALFLAGLDAAIVQCEGERTADLRQIEAAADQLRNLVRTDNGERAA